MPRRPYRLLPPLRKKRRFWTAVFPKGRKQVQRTTGTHSRQAAKEWAVCWIRENSPTLCAALDLRPIKNPQLSGCSCDGATASAPHPTLF